MNPIAATVHSHRSVPSLRNACSWGHPVCLFNIFHLESCPLCNHNDSMTQPHTNSTVPAYVFLSDLQSLSLPSFHSTLVSTGSIHLSLSSVIVVVIIVIIVLSQRLYLSSCLSLLTSGMTRICHHPSLNQAGIETRAPCMLDEHSAHRSAAPAHKLILPLAYSHFQRRFLACPIVQDLLTLLMTS